MENTKSDQNKDEGSGRVNGFFAMPKAVPAILLNILLERFSTTATSGDSLMESMTNLYL